MAMLNRPAWLPSRLPDLVEPDLRLLLGLGLVATAVYLAARGLSVAGSLALPGGLLLWDGVRNSGVWIAFRAFRQGDMAAVRRGLATVRWSHLLSPPARAYYHWLKGALDVADGRLAAARVHLLVAAAGELKTANDRALVQCLLAETALQDGDLAGARRHIELARGLSSNPGTDRMVAALAGRAGLLPG